MDESDILQRLYEVVLERKRERPEGSYVVELLDAGHARLAGKVEEEAREFIEAAGEDDEGHTVAEAADLLFHVIALLGWREISVARVLAELERRFGIGGLREKAAREKTRAE